MRLSKLFALLGSDSDGERLAALAAIDRHLASVGADWTDVSTMMERAGIVSAEPYAEPQQETRIDWREALEVCLRDALWHTEKERDFLETLELWKQRGKQPTEKQSTWLYDIYRRGGE